MKTSVTLFFTDILPHKSNFYGKVVKNRIFSPGMSQAEVFKGLKNAGIEGCELLLPSYARVTLEDMIEVKEVLDKNHMPVLSLHQPLRFFSKTRISEVALLFEMAALLGAKVVVLHISNAGKHIFSPAYIDAIHALEKQYGIRAGFENREKFIGSYMQKYTWNGDEFAALMKKNDFQITLDTTHLAQAGGDIIEFFKRYSSRIVNIHLSDYRENMWNTSFRPFRFKHMALGKGELFIPAFLKALREAKYQGLITMEIHSDLQGICASAKIINETVHAK